MKNIIAMNCICADIFVASGEIRPGGEALNFAANACHYPHLHVGVISAIGDDDCGKTILESMEHLPIDRAGLHVFEGKTTASNRTYLTKTGDRYYLPDSWNGGVYQSYALSDEDYALMANAHIVHVNHRSPVLEDILREKSRSHFGLSIDCNTDRNVTKLSRLASMADYFFISADDEFLQTLRSWSLQYSGIFVGTLAERGSIAYKNGLVYRAVAIPAETIVDTTGCGDSYQAGFIGAYTRPSSEGGGDILAAMKEGSRVASQTLTHFGGFSW
ncbi:MAG TPA: PfkB family carbohydrate kinase [Bacillota bacterium]|nr:PfkB family carbohydrate kinase [Bacillota bacterium]